MGNRGEIRTFSKGKPLPVEDNFTSIEFDCPCSYPDCKKTIIHDDLAYMLQEIRDHVGPLIIKSGFRCRKYQKELASRGLQTAVGLSQHEIGRAADIASRSVSIDRLLNAAKNAGFKAIGIARSFIHVDLRRDKIRTWEYK